MIFQDPYSSLNPTKTISESLREPLEVHRRLSAADAQKKVRGLLDHVGLPSDASGRLPRDFSGGQRQRIAIARALAVDPEVIVCDEPTSALDLSTQATVLNLLLQLQNELGLTYLFISHDLAVVRHIAHEVAVLQSGRIVEAGSAVEVTEFPKQEYTKRLVAASPVPDPTRQNARRREFESLAGAERGDLS
jgi:peptide/nickel transport system ATP-binding protein